MEDYKEFLQSKIKTYKDSGFETEDLNSNLFDFQRFIVQRALKAGRYALFCECGTGKTIMQLSWAEGWT